MNIRNELYHNLSIDENTLNKSVFVWGTGNTSQLYQKAFEREGITPKFYIDNDLSKRGTRFNNIEIKHPDDIDLGGGDYFSMLC